MLGLVDYSSDEEDAEAVQISETPPVNDSEPSIRPASKVKKVKSQSKKATKKKKKRVLSLATVLPPEIQAILERGGIDDDEDYEGNLVQTKRPKRAKAGGTEDNALLALLPAPEHSSMFESKSIANHHQLAASTGSPTNRNCDRDVPISASNAEEPKDQEDANEEHGQGADDDADDLGDDEDGVSPTPEPCGPFFSLTNTDPVEQVTARFTADKVANVVQAESPAVNITHGEAATNDRLPSTALQDDNVTADSTWRQQQQQWQEQQWQWQEQHHQQQQTYSGSYPQMAFHSEQGQKSKRAREKEIEKQIASGDFSMVDSLAEGVVQAPDTSTWNPHRHGHVEKRSEIAIGALTYNPGTGESKMIYQPSKTQKRKHQINSLAFTAAERELELMERRGQSMKTKAQTQAKYGW